MVDSSLDSFENGTMIINGVGLSPERTEGMAWRKKKPGYIASLNDAYIRCETTPAKEMVQAYSRLLRNSGGKLPAFRDLDLREVRHAATHMALCSIGIGDHCTIRFFGEELKQRVGVDPVGRNFFDFVHPDRADSIRQVMEMMVSRPCGYLAKVRQEFASGRTIVVETVALPLAPSRAGDDGQVVLTDTPTKFAGITLEKKKVLLSADVVQRDLIDLGYGVDEDFEDLVSDENRTA